MNPTDNPPRSFIDVPVDAPFPIQNLPYGVFSPHRGDPPRIGVAIGDFVLDLSVLEERGLFAGTSLRGAPVFSGGRLNEFMALGPAAWREVREQVQRLLSADVPTLRDDVALRDLALVDASQVQMHLPCDIPDFTDFYTSRDHALNVGRLFRGPDAALPPAFETMPLAYHGRASTIVVSGTDIPRPSGPYRSKGRGDPQCAPTRELDFELEVGLLIGRGSERGRPVSTRRAANQIFGLVLVNDWSARDIQQWEYQPLGPFLGKSFATSISPWVVPLAALEPFRCQPPTHDRPPLAYLAVDEPTAYDIELEVAIRTPSRTTEHVIARTNFRTQFWTLAQMVAHHTVAGCNLRTGDLLASGTVSGPEPDARGCLLELAQRGERPVRLPDGSERVFLEDGDTVILRGGASGARYQIGFGRCEGTVVPGLRAV